MDTSEQILKQLRWIKWLTALLALSFAAIAGTFVWMTHEMSSTFERASESSDFADRASTMLDEGKETEVLALVRERESKFPKDPYVHWYRGKAYYQLGQFTEALNAIRRSQELAPSWRDEYTGPLIKAIEEKLATKR
jgi:Flp pilus assembly protein TadD